MVEINREEHTILIPIKPKYVKQIFNGNKKYEYRKVKPKYKVNKMIIYSTSPVKKVVGEVEILDVLVDEKEKIWDITKEYSGINKDKYFNYYKSKDYAVAFKLGNVKLYDKPKELKDIGINYVPESYVYLN